MPEIDVSEGLALHLDPAILEAEGGTYTVDPSFRVQGDHYFVCIAADSTSGNWVPLFSNPGEGRFELRSEHKRGFHGWVTGKTHFHKGQTWQVPHAAIPEAARSGNDQSTPGNRNRVTPEGVEYIWANLALDSPAV